MEFEKTRKKEMLIYDASCEMGKTVIENFSNLLTFSALKEIFEVWNKEIEQFEMLQPKTVYCLKVRDAIVHVLLNMYMNSLNFIRLQRT